MMIRKLLGKLLGKYLQKTVKNYAAIGHTTQKALQKTLQPWDLALFPYFNVIKPTLENGFNYKNINWAHIHKKTHKANTHKANTHKEHQQ